MINIKPIIYEFIVACKQKYIPQKIETALEDLFFLKLPIWLIKRLTIEYNGYFKNFQPSKGDIVFDCGAWKGHFTLLASRIIGKDGIVYSFEPQKEMFDNIKKRLIKHKINNVIQVNCGLFNHVSTIRVNKRTHSGFSILNKELNGNEEIQLVDIDTFVKDQSICKIDFIKMDIEGAEIEALEGAKITLTKYSPKLAIASYHKRDGEQTAKRVEKFLNTLGYKSWTEFPAHLTTYGIR